MIRMKVSKTPKVNFLHKNLVDKWCFVLIAYFLYVGKKRYTEYVIHFKEKSSCSSSNLQWLPGNHCTGMLPLQCDGQSLVQLIDDT